TDRLLARAAISTLQKAGRSRSGPPQGGSILPPRRLAIPGPAVATPVLLRRRSKMTFHLRFTRVVRALPRHFWLALGLVLTFVPRARAEDTAATVRVSAPYVSLPVQVAIARGFFKA